MMKSDGKVFNRICLETGLKPDIPTLDAAILEDIKRFHLFNLPAVAFSVPDFDETIAAYLPYPIFKVAPLRRVANEFNKCFLQRMRAFVSLMLTLKATKSSTRNLRIV